MNIQPLDIAIHLINIVVFYTLIRMLLYKPVKAFMQKREERISSEMEAAKAANEEAAQADTALVARMKKADDEAQKRLVDSMQEAGERAGELLEKARRQAQELMQKAGEEAAETKKQALRDAAPEMADMAVKLAGEILGREVSKDDNRRLIDDFLDKAV